jgi:hypothetical protein
VYDYTTSPDTLAYIEHLKKTPEISGIPLIRKERRGRAGSTWINERLAYHFAIWTGDYAALDFMSQVFHGLRVDGVVTLLGQEQAPHDIVMERMFGPTTTREFTHSEEFDARESILGAVLGDHQSQIDGIVHAVREAVSESVDKRVGQLEERIEQLEQELRHQAEEAAQRLEELKRLLEQKLVAGTERIEIIQRAVKFVESAIRAVRAQPPRSRGTRGPINDPGQGHLF